MCFSWTGLGKHRGMSGRRVVINVPFFFEFCRNFPETCLFFLAGPIIVFHEVATLVHLIESSKLEVRAEGIRLIVLPEVP